MTLDANEQYEPKPFADALEALCADPFCKRLLNSVRFVGQPFPRKTGRAGKVSAVLPLMIDERNSGEDAFPTALALGWSGTSIKTCKGVLRALLHKARAGVPGAILSGKGLTCQRGLRWQQDTAMMAACEAHDGECNGHRFAAGMQGASTAETRHLLETDADIYTEHNGRTALLVEGGRVDIASLDAPRFAAPDRAGHERPTGQRRL